MAITYIAENMFSPVEKKLPLTSYLVAIGMSDKSLSFVVY